jgi:hypothetical protein
MNQQETAIALRHNSQIDEAWMLYVHFIKEGLPPAAALGKARDAVAVFKEWADGEYLEIPAEAEKQFFAPDMTGLTEAMKQLHLLMSSHFSARPEAGADSEDETRL